MKKIILSLCLICSLCSLFFFNPIDVYAYNSEDNFYPLNWEKCNLFVYYQGSSSTTHIGGATLSTDDNKYYFSNSDLNNITAMIFQRETPGAFTFPYDPNVFDYYLLGTVVAPNGPSNSQTTFKPTNVFITGFDVSTNSNVSYPKSDLVVYDLDTSGVKGFGFSEKVDFDLINNIGIHNITMNSDKDGSGNKPSNLTAEFGILAIDKSSSETTALSQILSQLLKMESSMTNAINNSTNSINNNISNSTGSINNNINSNTESIINNNNDNHNDLINGFQDSTINDSSIIFNESALELEEVESDLTGITNTSIDNYATAAFDASIITSLGPSLVYVVTWFTNFWNIGGLFTSLLNVGLALLVAAFMLRLHGGGK